MAYSGTTAATTLRNPPRCIAGGALYGAPGTTGLTTAPDSPNNQGGSLWYYASTNMSTDVLAAGFFTDGYYLGMRPGDIVMGVQFSSAGSSVQFFMGAVTGVSTASATLSTGSVITSTFS